MKCKHCNKNFNKIGNINAGFCSEKCRLDHKVILNEETGCHEWNGSINNCGYGYFRYNDRSNYLAHRASYEINVDAIPDGMVINHKCHNHKCVNPDHLEVTTQTENLKHKKEQKRLTINQIKHIREFGYSAHEVVDMFNILLITAQRILDKRTYKHI